MRQFISGNVTLLDEGSEGMYFILRDELTSIVQQLAIMEEELPFFEEVLAQRTKALAPKKKV